MRNRVGWFRAYADVFDSLGELSSPEDCKEDDNDDDDMASH